MNTDNINNYAYYLNFLNKEEVDFLLSDLKNDLQESILNLNYTNKNYRKSRSKSLEINEENEWFFDRLLEYVYKCNNENFGFHLYGISEKAELINYSRSGDHIEWHYDRGPGSPIRKLTCIVQMSDPADYGGCSLTINQGFMCQEMPKDLGSLIIFPSFMLHKVTPLLWGNRWSLTIWITGDAFI